MDRTDAGKVRVQVLQTETLRTAAQGSAGSSSSSSSTTNVTSQSAPLVRSSNPSESDGSSFLLNGSQLNTGEGRQVEPFVAMPPSLQAQPQQSQRTPSSSVRSATQARNAAGAINDTNIAARLASVNARLAQVNTELLEIIAYLQQMSGVDQQQIASLANQVQRNIEAAASHVNSAQQGVDALRQYREARSSASDDANPAARSRTRSPNQGSSHVIPPVRQTSSADEPTRIVPSSTAPASTSASEKTGIKLQIGGESPDVSTERKDEGEVHDDANASRTTTTTTPPTTTTTATQ